MLAAVQRGQLRRLCRVDPTLDQALEAICLKAMALKPEDRYATPRALADDIERWMADEPVTRLAGAIVATGPAVGAAKPDGGDRRWRPRCSSRWPAPPPCWPCRPALTASSSRPTATDDRQ